MEDKSVRELRVTIPLPIRNTDTVNPSGVEPLNTEGPPVVPTIVEPINDEEPHQIQPPLPNDVFANQDIVEPTTGTST